MFVSELEKSFSREWIAGTPWFSGQVKVSGISDVGRVRNNNQDTIFMDRELGLFVVADGMGGHAAGEMASQMAIQTIADEVRQIRAEIEGQSHLERRQLFSHIFNAASLNIYEKALEVPRYKGMGTTATLLWLPQKLVNASEHMLTGLIAHVGDSRCYLLRSQLLYQITDDHSLVHEQIKAGLIKPSELMRHQYKNVITRCLGVREDEEVDTFEQPLFEGDKFLLCSDGLTNKVSDAELGNLLRSEKTEDLPRILCEMANARGGEDNISVIVVELL